MSSLTAESCAGPLISGHQQLLPMKLDQDQGIPAFLLEDITRQLCLIPPNSDKKCIFKVVYRVYPRGGHTAELGITLRAKSSILLQGKYRGPHHVLLREEFVYSCLFPSGSLCLVTQSGPKHRQLAASFLFHSCGLGERYLPRGARITP